MESSSLDFASWPIRLVAYLIDDILPTIGGVLMVIGFFLGLISLFEDGDFGSEVSTALIIAGVFFLVLGAGILIAYLVWWLIVLGRAQTPGKQIVGIRAMNYAGEPLGWGMMFVREFLVKGLLFGILYGLTLGIMFFVDNLWPLWDENNQTLHDKVVSTYIVHMSQDPDEQALQTYSPPAVSMSPPPCIPAYLPVPRPYADRAAVENSHPPASPLTAPGNLAS